MIKAATKAVAKEDNPANIKLGGGEDFGPRSRSPRSRRRPDSEVAADRLP